jgi:hypothetical protein
LGLARIHKKLAEAQSFLDKMTEQDGLMTSRGFDDYLSAFLSAGMSVRDGFHYKQDRARNAAIKAWRENWEKAHTPEAKRLYEFMHVNRNAEVHTTGVALSVEKEPVRVGVGSSYSDRSGTVEAFGSPSVLLGHDTAVIIQKHTHYLTIDGTKQKATEACAAYLALLQRMVAQFEATHPLLADFPE